ncbi:MAG: flagellar type III secretion system pore protein FliP [Deltaproteobacteria bacterium]|nr:flagellar type III secretion system pore protein FliP [Deltaproteobacteria bacterium]
MRKIILISIIICLFAHHVLAKEATPGLNINLNVPKGPDDISNSLKILILLTILSLAPAILIMLTSFTRIIIVFSILRQALGTQQMPSNQVLIGLSLFITFFLMTPIFQKINETALKPYINHQISIETAYYKAMGPLRKFMLRQTRENDLALFVRLSKMPRPSSPKDIPTSVIIPAFIISELKTAFQMGFFVYIPFLVIDMVVSSVLLSMGMLMLPPIMISLPFKLMLFVLVDGWNLIVGSIIKSFVMG